MRKEYQNYQIISQIISIVSMQPMNTKLYILSAVFASLALAGTAFAQTTTSAQSSSSGQATGTTSTGLPVVRQPDGTCTLGSAGALVPCSGATAQASVVPATTIATTPIATTAGAQVAVTSQSAKPGLPNTGAGGTAAENLAIALISLAVLLGGGYLLASEKRTA